MSNDNICSKLKNEKKKRQKHRRNKAKNLGFKFHNKPIRKHGIRIAWYRDNINSRIATCLVCDKKGKNCTCKIEISNNQIHF